MLDSPTASSVPPTTPVYPIGRAIFAPWSITAHNASRVLTTEEIAQLAAFDGQNNPEALRNSTSGLVFWLPLFGDAEVMRNRCAP